MTETKNVISAMLRKIKIENFRGISDLNLSFLGPDERPTHVVVLAGPNGCGKTTILEACLLAAGRPELLHGARGSQAIRSGAGDYRIRADFQVGPETISVERTATNGHVKFVANCGYFSSWRAPKLVGAVSVTAGKKGNRPQQTEENRLWLIKQHLVNAKAHRTMSSQKTLTGTSQFDEVLERVNDIWTTFYPDREESFSVEPVGDDPDEGFDVFLSASDGSRVVLDALSSGQLEIFMLAGSALPDRSNETMLLIDEPELHLDSQWHRLILKAMQRLRPKCQFIIGTHSPEIYDSVMSYERHFLVPEEDPRAKAWESAVAEGVPA